MTTVRKGDEVELRIEGGAEKNLWVGRLEDGLRVFVDGPAAVGDTVRARVFKIKKRYLQARLENVVNPSGLRVEPPCAHFGLCGGCKNQHLRYDEQLRLKTRTVRDALERLGGFERPAVADCRPAAAVYGYRNKLDFSFSDRRYLSPEEMAVDPARREKPEDFALGFHAPGVYSKAIDIDACLLGSPDMNAALNAVRAFCLERNLSVYSTRTHEGFLRNLVVRTGGRTGERMVFLITSEHRPALMEALRDRLERALDGRLTTFVNGVTDRKNGVAFSDRDFIVSGPGWIRDRIGDCEFRISPNSFFQTNTAQAEVLCEDVLRAAALTGGEIVYDLYCGAGALTLTAARHGRRILGVEVIESAVRDARDNAARNGINNAEFLRLDMKDLSNAAAELEAFGRPEVVLTDPPRAGMHPKAVALLRELRPARIVYVSCHPASLARDGAMLCEEGLYRLGPVQPIDLFPQTPHVESVAVLTRGDSFLQRPAGNPTMPA
jgi:23S rRNA (uracil1939-C5)-methyltransferase